MAVRIQFRRGLSTEWTSANPTLSAGEFGFETDSGRFKIGNGSTDWSTLNYLASGTITGVTAGTGLTGGGTGGNVTLNVDTSIYISPQVVDAKGDLLVASAADTVTRLPVGTNGHALVADSSQTTGIKWSAVGDVTLSGSQTLTNKTITSPVITTVDLTGGVVDQLQEDWNIVSSAASGTINLNVRTASIWYYTNNATDNITLNIRGDGSTTLNSILAVGDSVTVVFLNTNGSTAYYPSVFQIDGSEITPKWQGGVIPTTGNSLSIDAYTYAIVKTSATPTYQVLASQTQFK